MVGWEPNTGHPVRMTLLRNGVFAFSKSVPQLDGLVPTARDNLSIVYWESHAQNILKTKITDKKTLFARSTFKRRSPPESNNKVILTWVRRYLHLIYKKKVKKKAWVYRGEPWCGLQTSESFCPWQDPRDAASCPKSQTKRNYRRTTIRHRWQNGNGPSGASEDTRIGGLHALASIQSTSYLKR